MWWGFILDPPDWARALCLDESELQSPSMILDAAGLPLKKGRCGTMTHY